MNYRMAPEVQEIAEGLIFDIEELNDLSAANIQYVVTDKAARENGREIPGKATKVSGVGALLASVTKPDTWTFVPDVLVVEVSETYWRTMNDTLALDNDKTRYLSHFVTCPQATDWRRT